MLREEIERMIDDLLKDMSWSTVFKTVDLAYTIKGDRCVVICTFYTDNNREKAVKLLDISKDTKDICKELSDWMSDLERSLRAIQKLNELEQKFEEQHQYYVGIIYRWGDSEDYCSISDWDYSRIELRLSSDSIQKLVCLENTIEDIINSEELHEYDDIISYIKNISSRELNSSLGIKLKTSNIVGELMKNRLSFKEVKEVIDTSIKGEQLISSAVTIRDLDLIGIYIININYNTKVIGIEISDDKLLDMESGKFIMDNILGDRLIQIMITKLKKLLQWA